MPADRYRLLRQLAKLQRGGNSNSESQLQRILRAAEASSRRLEARHQLEPRLEFDPELPISQYREQVQDLLRRRQVLVVCGETGSGKSTQLPKICLEIGRGRKGMIGHTQPRRLAATSIANRLAEEMQTDAGKEVGFKIRFTDRTNPMTLVKLMTDGVLLAELGRDRYLNAYDTIILDEAHERSLNIDILIGYLHQLLPKRPDLKLIITSATIDAERFSEHFQDAAGPAPILTVEGRTFPVEIRYRGPYDSSAIDHYTSELELDDSDDEQRRWIAAVEELLNEGAGDILAFFPSQHEILVAAKRLRGFLTRTGLLSRTEVLPLYSRLSESEQRKVFQSHTRRRIVLATNVAESSLTVPGIRYVIDTGTARISRYAGKSKVRRLPIEPISKASADQRAGRCGRVGPGICIRLYSQEDYEGRIQFTTPEIRRANLASVVLQTRLLGLGNPDDLPLIDPPRTEAVREACDTLFAFGALDEKQQLTSLGRTLGRWPIDPGTGRILIEAAERKCLHECLIIASGLEVQDPRIRPPEKAQAADEAHQKFIDPHSDFLTLIRIWDFYHNLKGQLGRRKLEKALTQNFLSPNRLREWSEVQRQLSQLTRDSRLQNNRRTIQLSEIRPDIEATGGDDQGPPIKRSPPPEGYDAIHQSLLTGLIFNIALREDRGIYRGIRNLELKIWPGSGLKRTQSTWLLGAELVETTQRFIRCVASIQPGWIEPIAKHLMKFSYNDPFWSKKRGAAMVNERGTLLGLPVVGKRPVPLAAIDPKTARRLLIDEGLVEDMLVTRAAFVRHNREFLDEIRGLCDRTRSAELRIDSYWLQKFYEEQIPLDVVDRNSLERWDRQISKQKGKANLPEVYLTREKLDRDLTVDDIESNFPSTLDLSTVQLPLDYRFSPESDDDGVTVTVPESITSHLNPERLEWLVPGLFQQKLVALIKSLPKRLRRNLVPAAEVAAKAASMIDSAEQEFWPTICETLGKLGDIKLRKSDFQLEKIPPHLRLRIRVVSDAGETIATSRELNELQLGQTTGSNSATVDQIESQPWYRDQVHEFDFEELPSSIVVDRGGIRVRFFPTIQEVDGALRTTTVESPGRAEALLLSSAAELIYRKERREIRSQIRYLPEFESTKMRLAPFCPAGQLEDRISRLMVRVAFFQRVRPPRSAADFQELQSEKLVKIGTAAQTIGNWLPKFSTSVHELLLMIEEVPKVWEKPLECVGYQLDRLVCPDFLDAYPWQWLQEYPRYFQAMKFRLEKLRTQGLQKDLDQQRLIDDCTKQLAEFRSEATKDNRFDLLQQLEEMDWEIEELRVSVFAQQLGTRIRVSPQRIQKRLQDLGS